MLRKFLKKKRIIVYSAILSIYSLYYFLFRDSEVYMPRTLGYKFIEVPKNEYIKFDEPGFPYSFSISKYAKFIEVKEEGLGPYCINIYYPIFDVKLQLTYKNFQFKETELRQYIRSSKSIAFKHKCRSYQIKEKVIVSGRGCPCVLIEIFGDVPTHIQFFTTDEKQHFLRGALYFKYSATNEEVEPIVDFIKRDIQELIDTLEWKP